MIRAADDLWSTRDQSLAFLAEKHPSRLVVIERGFELLDDTARAFEAIARPDDYTFVCSLTCAKGKNFALAMYSVILDGLGQEAGALLRPFTEYVELLTYFRLVPARAKQAIDGTLPSAGNRAIAIMGMYGKLRAFLNDHAAHGSYTDVSIRHVFDHATATLRLRQPFAPNVLLSNLQGFVVQLLMLLYEATHALQVVEADSLHFHDLAVRWEAFKQRVFDVYQLDLPSEDQSDAKPWKSD